MKHWRSFVLFVLALAGCDQPQTPTQEEYASPAGAAGAGPLGGMGGMAGNAGDSAGGTAGAAATCGGVACSQPRGLVCCTAADTCGLDAPSHLFEVECIDEGFRGGTVTNDCPSSPEYCDRSNCQTLEGCRRDGDDLAEPCGYWVDGWTIIGGQEAFIITARLGCVRTDEFVTE